MQAHSLHSPLRRACQQALCKASQKLSNPAGCSPVGSGLLLSPRAKLSFVKVTCCMCIRVAAASSLRAMLCMLAAHACLLSRPWLLCTAIMDGVPNL